MCTLPSVFVIAKRKLVLVSWIFLSVGSCTASVTDVYGNPRSARSPMPLLHLATPGGLRYLSRSAQRYIQAYTNSNFYTPILNHHHHFLGPLYVPWNPNDHAGWNLTVFLRLYFVVHRTSMVSTIFHRVKLKLIITKRFFSSHTPPAPVCDGKFPLSCTAFSWHVYVLRTASFTTDSGCNG